MSSSDIYIKLDQPAVTVEDFYLAVQAVFDVVHSVSEDAHPGSSKAVRWIISRLEKGSAVLVATPEIIDDCVSSDIVKRNLKLVGDGFRSLEKSDDRPPHFPDKALKAARKFSEIVNAGRVGSTSLRFGSVPIKPSKRVAGNVDGIISGRQKSIGSIEGRLVTLTVRDQFVIYVVDRVSQRRVECHITDEMLPIVRDAFNNRVIVRGVIWASKDGSPQRVDVRQFEAIKPDDLLPKSRDVRGILKNRRVNG